MLTAERKRLLLDVLRMEGKIHASDLSKRLGVSEDTVRRDLRELDKAGLLQRVHGGALPRSPTSIHYAEREKESAKAAEVGQSRSPPRPAFTVRSSNVPLPRLR